MEKQKGFTPLERKHSSRNRFLTGFTLIEIMLVVAILSLATVFISPSNMMALEAYSKYSRSLVAQTWAGEKMWEAKEMIFESSMPEVGESAGTFSRENKIYRWQLTVDTADVDLDNLYSIQLTISWKVGPRTDQLSRFAFVQKKENLV